MNGDSISTRQKALALNLDATRYGTFAEIGGGQEVARWFFPWAEIALKRMTTPKEKYERRIKVPTV
jgi:hypothetical protein